MNHVVADERLWNIENEIGRIQRFASYAAGPVMGPIFVIGKLRGAEIFQYKIKFENMA